MKLLYLLTTAYLASASSVLQRQNMVSLSTLFDEIMTSLDKYMDTTREIRTFQSEFHVGGIDAIIAEGGFLADVRASAQYINESEPFTTGQITDAIAYFRTFAGFVAEENGSFQGYSRQGFTTKHWRDYIEAAISRQEWLVYGLWTVIMDRTPLAQVKQVEHFRNETMKAYSVAGDVYWKYKTTPAGWVTIPGVTPGKPIEPVTVCVLAKPRVTVVP